MTKKQKQKLNRQWGQWKRRYLSSKEKKKIEVAMYIDFLAAKGYEKVIASLFNS